MIRPLLAIVTLVALSGCGIVGEERSYYMKKDFNRLFNGSFRSDAGESLGGGFSLTARGKEQRAEQDICLHKNGQNRIIRQDGVEDSLAYRRCALAPYANNGGTRMGIRPDGIGIVVRK